MSIEATIKRLRDDGRLIEYVPAFTDPDFEARRTVFMSHEAHIQCPPSGAPGRQGFRGQALTNARQGLEAFIGGEELFYDEDMKLLDPSENEIWSMRVLERPQSRLFGWFVVPAVFLVTHCRLRDGLDWNRETERSIKKRNEKFSDLPIFSGYSFNDYITY